MKKILNGVVVCLGVLSVTGCITGSKIVSPEGKYQPVTNLKDNEVGVVFYRLAGKEDKVATVKIDDKVVGSLEPKHFAMSKGCTFNLNVGVAERGTTTAITQYHPTIDISKTGEKELFFRVDETPAGGFSVGRIENEAAKKEIDAMKLQSNIINRAYPDCTPPAAPVVVAPVVVEKPKKVISINVKAHFLTNDTNFFERNRAELTRLSSFVQEKLPEIQSIVVTGHTDRMGKPEYNKVLSEKRAQTVAEYLRTNGVSVPIQAVGKGSSEPVTDGCYSKKGEALKACLQSDRRVIVDLIMNTND